MIVGVMGGGQLGRMLALAGYPLGLRFRTLDLSSESPAGQMTELMVADFNDTDALKRFAHGLDVATYEFENVPVDSARFLERRVLVYPPSAALEVGQDRLIEKTFFQKLGVPTPPFVRVDSWDELKESINGIGLPAVLKTRRFGYDGKGQFILRKTEDAPLAWQSLGGVPLIYESFIPFEREVSVLAVRGRSGETAFYPVVENHHRDGILRLSLCPAPGAGPEVQAEAEDYARRALEALNYVGVLAIEFFQHEGRLLANEMAPRVHNSGHWTIEGAATSQFENHLRAIVGLPLGSTEARGYSAMVNLIGTIPDRRAVLSVPGSHLHLYGKSPRPNRKLGHVTVTARSAESRDAQVSQIRGLLAGQI
ncbi:MAG TPA: 5-(carboxyamino)imidazole ribonucleotide synthase [Blastocatellia bacterium]|jgi:5-(carboxyamino)imidazole ribonucleotide synthase|nr:5-(carboxyamino)imidazole ribonucleotide synthase [Blastocatellia bacterium]